MTPHIESNKEDIAKTVLMPGDPLRAKYIADHYLEDARLVNTVRNMFAYTGKYKGKELTVFSSGMGMPSMGIYSYELYNFYDVENIIRIGSAGSYVEDVKLLDVLVAKDCYSESSFASVQNNNSDSVISADFELNDIIRDTANNIGQNIKIGTIHSSDVFYKQNDNFKELVSKYNCLGVEMEAFALFNTAKILNKKAACILTVSDSFVSTDKLTPEERQNGFNDMMILALETAIKL